MDRLRRFKDPDKNCQDETNPETLTESSSPKLAGGRNARDHRAILLANRHPDSQGENHLGRCFDAHNYTKYL